MRRPGGRWQLAAALAVICVCTLAPAEGRAEGQTELKPLDARAEEHFQRGLAHYKAEEYEAAIAEFQAGFEIDPHPKLLFNWAQSERLSGDCATAVELYRRLAAEQIPPAYAEVVSDNLTFCERALAHPPIQDNDNNGGDVDPVPSPDPADRALTAPPPPDQGARRPWYVDPIGGALVAAGVVSMTVGLYYYDVSASELEDALDAPTYPEFRQHLSDARTDRVIAQVAGGLGLVSVTAGVLRYVLHDSPRRDTKSKGVGVTIGAGGGMLTIGGEF